MEDLNLIFEESGAIVVGNHIELLVPAMTMVIFPRGSIITRSSGERFYVASYGEKTRKDGMLFVRMTLEKQPKLP